MEYSQLKGSVDTLKSLVQTNEENQVCRLRVVLCAKQFVLYWDGNIFTLKTLCSVLSSLRWVIASMVC